MPPFKISIVIPTRNRSIYLRPCIRTCLSSPDRNIEVIVSDNDSDDATRETVAAIQDERLRYVNTGRSVSMRQNFEFALSHATGDYVIYIGDDDGILPNGLATLRRVLNRYKPDIVAWRHITYKWPRTQPQAPGVLKFRYRDFFGPMEKINVAERLKEFCDAKPINYRDGGNIYHGCVSRHVIDRIMKKTGEYFLDQIPDVYVAMANLAVAESFLWIRNPVTLAGESEKSNGAAITTPQSQTQEQAAIAASFKNLSEEDPVKHPFDVTVRSIPAYTYAILNKINHLLCDNSLVINHANWRARVMEDLQKYGPGIRQVNINIMNKYFATVDPDFAVPPELSLEESAQVQPSRKAPKPVSSYIEARNKTVESAAAWLTQVTHKDYMPSLIRPVAALHHIIMAVQMYARERAMRQSGR